MLRCPQGRITDVISSRSHATLSTCCCPFNNNLIWCCQHCADFRRTTAGQLNYASPKMRTTKSTSTPSRVPRHADSSVQLRQCRRDHYSADLSRHDLARHAALQISPSAVQERPALCLTSFSYHSQDPSVKVCQNLKNQWLIPRLFLNIILIAAFSAVARAYLLPPSKHSLPSEPSFGRYTIISSYVLLYCFYPYEFKSCLCSQLYLHHITMFYIIYIIFIFVTYVSSNIRIHVYMRMIIALPDYSSLLATLNMLMLCCLSLFLLLVHCRLSHARYVTFSDT